MSRREYVFTSSRDEPFERRDEKKRNEHLVSIGGKCGTTVGVEEVASREVHRGQTSLKPDPSSEENLHAFTVET